MAETPRPGTPMKATLDAEQAALPLTPSSPGPKGHAALGRRAASGFLAMSMQSLLTRAVTFVAQVVLAKLLLPADFGLFGVAMGIVMFASLLQNIGVREVLISRQKRFGLWVNVSMWVSLALAVVTTIGIAIAAPLAAASYNEPQLLGMLLVLAASQPLYSVTVAHEAKLQIDLRFRELAMVNLVQGGLQPLLMVGCALSGFGAYSFVIPRLVLAVVRAVWLHRLVPLGIRRDPQLRLWRYILRPGVVVLATALVFNVASAGPALLLGKTEGTETAGYFSFAWNLTYQGVVVLALMLDNVMFPTLGRLSAEPERQRQATLRVFRTLGGVMVPLCVVQGVASGPLFAVLFGSKWDAAVPLAQILSWGMIYVGAFAPMNSLLSAQARFGDRLRVGLMWMAVFIAMMIVGERLGGAKGVAVAVGLNYFGMGLHLGHIAFKRIGGSWVDLVKELVPLHVVGLVGVAAGVMPLVWMPGGEWWKTHVLGVAPWAAEAVQRLGADRLAASVQLMAVVVMSGLACVIATRVFVPGTWHDLVQAGEPMLRKLGLGRVAGWLSKRGAVSARAL